MPCFHGENASCCCEVGLVHDGCGGAEVGGDANAWVAVSIEYISIWVAVKILTLEDVTESKEALDVGRRKGVVASGDGLCTGLCRDVSAFVSRFGVSEVETYWSRPG